MVYIFQDLEGFSDKDFYSSMGALSEERLKKVQKYKFMLDRKVSSIAYLMLRYALFNEYGTSKKVKFCYNRYGKPYLTDFPNVHFSLSHCKRGVACAVANSEVGCDIQNVDKSLLVLSKDIFSDYELNRIVTSDNTLETFTMLWCAKESYFKCLGTGLVNHLNLTDFSAIDVGNPTIIDGKILSYQLKFKGCYVSICSKDLDTVLNPVTLDSYTLMKGGLNL